MSKQDEAIAPACKKIQVAVCEGSNPAVIQVREEDAYTISKWEAAFVVLHLLVLKMAHF